MTTRSCSREYPVTVAALLEVRLLKAWKSSVKSAMRPSTLEHLGEAENQQCFNRLRGEPAILHRSEAEMQIHQKLAQ
jgi:hypothetical protein